MLLNLLKLKRKPKEHRIKVLFKIAENDERESKGTKEMMNKTRK